MWTHDDTERKRRHALVVLRREGELIGAAAGQHDLDGLLLLTSLYIVVVGTSRFGLVYRVLSLLALGTVMLVVSLVFTRLRKRPH